VDFRQHVRVPHSRSITGGTTVVKKFLIGFLLSTASVWAQSQQPFPTHVQTLAHAIATAEGYYVDGSRPARLHNPGDIRSKYQHVYLGQVGLDPQGYVIFRNSVAGFIALEMQIQRIIRGESRYYSPHMTFAAFARRYVGGTGAGNWARIVVKELAVTPDTTLEWYLEIEPVIAMK
jgi:hypothetical protein